MLIICPGCSIPYDLPPHLLGPAGARISCPACQLTFVLGPDGGLAAVLGQPEPATDEASAGANGAAGTPGAAAFASEPAPETPSLAALRALDDPAGALAAAAAAGRLFADYGPALLDAFESLERERPGEGAAAEFREALRAVAGVELAGTVVGVEAGEIR